MVDPTHMLVLTNSNLVQPIHELLPAIPRQNIIAEPTPAGTAGALIWAARLIEQRDGSDATMISVHADWAIGDDEKFRKTLEQGDEYAQKTHTLVTVGVVPTRADPGFGYVQPSDPEASISKVKRFVEKPDREKAAKLRAEGYLWNSGIFIWTVGDFLAQAKEHAVELKAAIALPSDAEASEFFGKISRPIAVDNAVLERSKNVAVVRGSFGWDDIGTWSALGRIRDKDEFGNVATGDVHLLDCADNVVHAEDGRVVMYGVEKLVVVVRDGLTLVTTRDYSSDLKRLVESLPGLDGNP